MLTRASLRSRANLVCTHIGTQHLFNCRSDPGGTICRFADLLGVDRERIRLWTFARAAAEPRDNWGHGDSMALAKTIVS